MDYKQIILNSENTTYSGNGKNIYAFGVIAPKTTVDNETYSCKICFNNNEKSFFVLEPENHFQVENVDISVITLLKTGGDVIVDLFLKEG